MSDVDSASMVLVLVLKGGHPRGGGVPKVAASENEEALAKLQSGPSGMTIVSHLAKVASQS